MYGTPGMGSMAIKLYINGDSCFVSVSTPSPSQEIAFPSHRMTLLETGLSLTRIVSTNSPVLLPGLIAPFFPIVASSRLYRTRSNSVLSKYALLLSGRPLLSLQHLLFILPGRLGPAVRTEQIGSDGGAPFQKRCSEELAAIAPSLTDRGK